LFFASGGLFVGFVCAYTLGPTSPTEIQSEDRHTTYDLRSKLALSDGERELRITPTQSFVVDGGLSVGFVCAYTPGPTSPTEIQSEDRHTTYDLRSKLALSDRERELRITPTQSFVVDGGLSVGFIHTWTLGPTSPP
jgi:hypothetical protein